jgi:hypothetical protein
VISGVTGTCLRNALDGGLRALGLQIGQPSLQSGTCGL